MAVFKSIKINEEFIFKNQTWIKTLPVKKGARCCGKVLYNAYVVSNKSIQQVFKPNQEVETI